VKRIQIERKCKVSPADIAREYLGGAGKPVVITDGIQNWPARSKWTFEFFKTCYGSDLGTAWRGLGSGVGKLTTLSHYIDFLDTPAEELPGLWTGREIGKDRMPPPPRPGRGSSPLYLMGWHGFQRHPELYDDILPAPYFVPSLVSVLDPTLRDIFEWTSEKEYWAVYIGPEGSLSPLHRDYWNTHGYLAQIRGRKRAILFSPDVTEFLYDGKVDPEQPDFERFPLLDRATAYECVIGPGDTLLMPANWWHHVRGLEKSITVSHNFFSESNLSEHIMHILRNLPALVKGIDNSADWRQKLRIEWSASDLATADLKTSHHVLGTV
jgi:hypothetical protein